MTDEEIMPAESTDVPSGTGKRTPDQRPTASRPRPMIERASASLQKNRPIGAARRASPARRHFQRATAAKQAGESPAGKPASGDQYELMSAALWQARQTLKNIQSIEAKIAKKRELLPEFAPYIDGVLAADSGAQDDVLMTLMVWLFDVGELDTALRIAAYALKHQLKTPDQYQRHTAAIVAEQTAEEALKLLKLEDTDRTGLIAALTQAEALTAEADMHDQIRAKLHKALGFALREAGNHHAALNHLQRALELNANVGVKKDIEKLERELKKDSQASGASLS